MPGMTLYIGRYLFIIHKQEVVLARGMYHVCGKVVENPAKYPSQLSLCTLKRVQMQASMNMC